MIASLSPLASAYAFLVLAIVLNMAGHLLFKAGAVAAADPLASYVAPYTLLGFGAYGLSALAYIAALRVMPLSVAMPSMVVGYLGTALVAHFLWGEAFGARQWAAFVLIAAGMFLLHR
jgi:undecaprenyl phosphate-alpha-L-ara4N flippase subunit ArnE